MNLPSAQAWSRRSAQAGPADNYPSAADGSRIMGPNAIGAFKLGPSIGRSHWKPGRPTRAEGPGAAAGGGLRWGRLSGGIRAGAWAAKTLGTEDSGHQRLWAPKTLGTKDSGHQRLWAPKTLGTE